MNQRFLVLIINCLLLLVVVVESKASKSYYDILGVKKTDSIAQIKKAFRNLALKYHPDKNPDKSAEEKFREIVKAYETLSDPEKRKQYDQFGDASAFENFQSGHGGAGAGGAGGGFQNFDFHEFFKHFDEAFNFHHQAHDDHFQGGHHFHSEHMRNHQRAHKENMKHSFGGHFGFNFDDLFSEDSTFGDMFSDDSFYHHSSVMDHQHGGRGGQTCKTVTKQVGNTITQYTTCS